MDPAGRELPARWVSGQQPSLLCDCGPAKNTGIVRLGGVCPLTGYIGDGHPIVYRDGSLLMVLY